MYNWRVISWQEFCCDLQLLIRWFVFLWLCLALSRTSFLLAFIGNLADSSNVGVVFDSMVAGSKLSLKTCWWLSIIPFACGNIPRLFYRKWPVWLTYKIYGTIVIAGFCLLLQVRIPYYEQFSMAFSPLMFTAVYDDVGALLVTFFYSFGLWWRLALAILSTVLFSWLWQRILTIAYWQCSFKHRWYWLEYCKRGLVVVCSFAFFYWSYYGGAWYYGKEMVWENAGLTNDRFLNEVILDDGQALWRAWQLDERIKSCGGIDVSPAAMRKYGRVIAGDSSLDSNDWDDYTRRWASGRGLGDKPKQIFLIVAESYATWPFLEQYDKLEIVEASRMLAARDDSVLVLDFLPNGMSTVGAITGIVSGLADANLYMNYLPESYCDPYSTAIAPALVKLGYRCNFWYGGPNSWERVEDFVRAQGFQQFIGRGDIMTNSGNIWGCDDKDLFNVVSQRLDRKTASFNVILTVSNHLPYNVDISAAGFSIDKIAAGLTDDQKNDAELVRALGHYWYTDQMLNDFVNKMRQEIPDSLFVIVGDHANRLNLEKQPDMFRQYAVPLLIHGQGISKTIWPRQIAGSHIDIAATIVDLLAPAGWEYHSLGHSLLSGNDFAVNYGWWMNKGMMGVTLGREWMGLPDYIAEQKPDYAYIDSNTNAVRAMSYWRIMRGKYFEEITH